MSLYLYGILPAPGPKTIDLMGLDEQPVDLYTLGDFVFIYSASQRERYRTSRLNLLTHERVLEALMHQGYTCMLPLQFGLAVLDWTQVELDLVSNYQPALKKLFARLQGMREVGLKIYWNLEHELQSLNEDPQIRKARDPLMGKVLSMDQTIAIGQLIAAALQTRQEELIQQFDQILIPLAQAVKDNSTLTKEMIYNKAFLIQWDEEPQFEHQVERLDAQYGERLRIRYNNFTAPYNFAQLEDTWSGN